MAVVTYVSRTPGREHMKLKVKKETKAEVTVEVDRQILDKTTGELRLDKRTVVIPKENWKYWLLAYKEEGK
jgi:hypothetical protein